MAGAGGTIEETLALTDKTATGQADFLKRTRRQGGEHGGYDGLKCQSALARKLQGAHGQSSGMVNFQHRLEDTSASGKAKVQFKRSNKVTRGVYV